MNYKNIVVAGAGVLGSQIAFQTAYCGFNVTALVREEDDKTAIKKRFKKLLDTYISTIELMGSKVAKTSDVWAFGISSPEDFNKRLCIKNAKKAFENIIIETNSEKALCDADLLIESITEDIKIKNAFYEGIKDILPEKTVIVTNSSTLLPSKMAKATGREDKFLALHFANSIWKNNISEIMAQSKTDEKYLVELDSFAKAIKMVPLVAKEEKSGYILNSMLVPFLLSAMDLLANGVSDVETIDKAWELGTGAPHGPFRILDVVGLETARYIVTQYQKVPDIFDPLFKKMMLPYNYDGMLEILDKMMAEGKTGKAAGEGFYKYKK